MPFVRVRDNSLGHGLPCVIFTLVWVTREPDCSLPLTENTRQLERGLALLGATLFLYCFPLCFADDYCRDADENDVDKGEDGGGRGGDVCGSLALCFG
jgi:hypothetical protein